MAVAMKIEGLVNGGRTGFDGEYLVEYDPERDGFDPLLDLPMDAFVSTTPVLAEAKRFALTSRGSRTHTEMRFEPGDAFVFGPEAAGLTDEFVAAFPADARIRIPMIPGNRSLNLSNAVAVVVYEAWRQHGFAGAQGDQALAKS